MMRRKRYREYFSENIFLVVPDMLYLGLFLHFLMSTLKIKMYRIECIDDLRISLTSRLARMDVLCKFKAVVTVF